MTILYLPRPERALRYLVQLSMLLLTTPLAAQVRQEGVPGGKVKYSAAGKTIACYELPEIARALKGQATIGVKTIVNSSASMESKWDRIAPRSPTAQEFEALEFSFCMDYLQDVSSLADYQKNVKELRTIRRCMLIAATVVQKDAVLKRCLGGETFPKPSPTPPKKVPSEQQKSSEKQKEPAAAKFFHSVTSFWFPYDFEDVNGRGPRTWTRARDTWSERFPNGSAGPRETIARAIVEGDAGEIVRAGDGGRYEYFIPDIGGRTMFVRIRLDQGDWSFLGQMRDIK
jgi:hypothetical protein